MKNILCFGDSNTWGYIPGSGVRFDASIRWTGVCQTLLGDSYILLEDGLNGRTTVYDDPCNVYSNGKKSLGYSLLSQKPLDLVVLCLGTNDLKFTNAVGAANGVDALVRIIMGAETIFNASQPVCSEKPRVLLMAPPHIAPEIDERMPDSAVAAKAGESFRFAQLYDQVAKNRGAGFLDAAMFAEASLADCVHIDAASHQRLGRAVADAVREILEN